MKPYADLNGKARRTIFWGDQVKKRIRKVFKKSARRSQKKECKNYQ